MKFNQIMKHLHPLREVKSSQLEFKDSDYWVTTINVFVITTVGGNNSFNLIIAIS